MQQQAHMIAQRLLNLYRQAHVINGGWAAVNQVLLNESSDAQVIAELENLPTGKNLVQHINNLRSGVTPMNSIDDDLLPYGGMMAESETVPDMVPTELQELISAIDSFDPSQEGVNRFMDTPLIKKFGDDWVLMSKNALSNDPETLRKFDDIVRISRAYQLWASANEILAKPITERIRANLQVDMPEYETYLPMFGNDGKELLRRLHGLTSSMPSHKKN